MSSRDPVDLLRRAGGVASFGTLGANCSARDIRQAVDAGAIVRIARGRYALPGADDALVAAVRVGGVVSRLSAAQAWGWPVKTPPPRPQVTIRRGSRSQASDREGVDVAWADLPPSAVRSGRITSPVQTVLDCSRTLPFDEALCVADSALRSGTVRPAELVVAAESSPRTGRAAALHVAHHADARAANPFESCLRAVAITVPGLTVTPQLTIPRVGRVDLADVALRIVIEGDSFEFHSHPADFRRDIRRYTALVREGWRVLRFCWEDAMYQQGYVAAVLGDLVRQPAPNLGQFVPSGRDRRL